MISCKRRVSRLLGGKEPKAKSLSVDPFNHQKSSRYSSLVAVGLWLSFIGLNWTSFSWYAARINSLALSSCLALKHLCKYRVCLKYLWFVFARVCESTSDLRFAILIFYIYDKWLRAVGNISLHFYSVSRLKMSTLPLLFLEFISAFNLIYVYSIFMDLR